MRKINYNFAFLECFLRTNVVQLLIVSFLLDGNSVLCGKEVSCFCFSRFQIFFFSNYCLCSVDCCKSGIGA